MRIVHPQPGELLEPVDPVQRSPHREAVRRVRRGGVARRVEQGAQRRKQRFSTAAGLGRAALPPDGVGRLTLNRHRSVAAAARAAPEPPFLSDVSSPAESGEVLTRPA